MFYDKYCSSLKVCNKCKVMKLKESLFFVVVCCHLWRPVQEKPIIPACMRRHFPSEWSRVLHMAAQAVSGPEPAVQLRRSETHCTGLFNKRNIS